MICVMFFHPGDPFKFRYFHYLVWPTDCEQLYLIRHACQASLCVELGPHSPVSRVAEFQIAASLQAGDPGFSEAHGFPEAILHKLGFLTRSAPLDCLCLEEELFFQGIEILTNLRHQVVEIGHRPAVE